MIAILLVGLVNAYIDTFAAEFTTDTFTDVETDSWEKIDGGLPPTGSWVSDCGVQQGHRIFGGYRVFVGYKEFTTDKNLRLKLRKNFTGFPPHWSKYVKVSLFKIDSWNAPKDYFMVYVNGIMVKNYTDWICCSKVFDICGSNIAPSNPSSNYAFNDQILYFQHNLIGTQGSQDSFSILFDSFHNQQQNQAWGFRDFYLYIDRCFVSCLTCDGPTSSDCLSCTSDSTLSGGKCLCNTNNKDLSVYCSTAACSQCRACNINQYVDTTQRFCITCTQPCTQCSSPSVCSQCQLGYYLNLGSCITCIFPCKQCTSASLCTNCQDGYYLNSFSCNICDETVPVSTCSTCPQGRYLNLGQCKKCYEGCSACSSNKINSCSSCLVGYYLMGSVCLQKCVFPKYGVNETRTCQNNCPDGTAGDVRTRICKPCHSNCLKCAIPQNENLCFECAPNFYIDLVKCVSVCPVSKIAQQFTKSCLDYHLSVHNNSCEIACQPGTYYDVVQFTCRPCDPECFACDKSASNCTYCKPPLWLFNNECLNDCPTGTFKDQLTQSCVSTCQPSYFKETVNAYCQICAQPCTICLDGTILNCSSCKSPFTLYGNKCLKDCNPDFFDLQSHDCVSSCSQGKFADSFFTINVCNTCHKRCKSCYGVTNGQCTQCFNPYSLASSGCYIICTNPKVNSNDMCVDLCPYSSIPTTMIPGNPYLICSKCDPSCEECFGTSNIQCTACTNGKYLNDGLCQTVCTSPKLTYSHNNKKLCLASCPDSFYASSAVCNSCIQKCKKCSDGLQCQKCHQEYFLQPNGACKKTCPLQYSFNGTNCDSCGFDCQKCTISNTQINCSLCNSGNIFQNKCQVNCPNGYFPYSHTCQKCQQSCTKCANFSYCSQCKTDYFLMQNTCINECPLGMFYNYAQTRCQNCIITCIKCNAYNNCQLCIKGYTIVDGGCQNLCSQGNYNKSTLDCQQNCLLGYFQNQHQACQKCHPNCLTCKASHFDQCIKCNSKRGTMENQPINNLCNCWDNYSQTLEGMCDLKNKTQSQDVVIGSASVLAATLASSLLIIIINRKRLLFYKLLDFMQTTGLLVYLNIILPYSSSKIMEMMNLANFSPLYYMLMGESGLQKSTSRALIESKFEIQGKTEYFLYTSLIVIALTILSWGIVLILKCCSYKFDQIEECRKKRIFRWFYTVVVYALPIQIFLRTFLDCSLNIALQIHHQLQNPSWTDIYSLISFFLSFAFLLYAFGLLIFFYIKIDLGRIVQDQEKHQEYHSLIYQIGLTSSKWSFIWTLLICIRKLIFAFIIVFLYSKPLITIIIFLTVNALLLLYSVVLNPYNSFIFRIYNVFVQITNTSLCIILLVFMLQKDSRCSMLQPDRQKLGWLLQCHLILQLCIQCIFIVYYLMLLVPLIKKVIQKCFCPNSQQREIQQEEIYYFDQGQQRTLQEINKLNKI